MKVLIAPWGNPGGWEEVAYEFEGRKVKSKTSLKILQDVIRPDKTFIIGLDTLAEKGSNYRDVKENAKEKIDKYANKFEIENYNVLVAPGIGAFQNGIFIGMALDYYYHILAKISFELLKFFDKKIEIYLDLTYGLNYSTILTYKAVKEILEVFSIFGEIKFKAYNADPSLPTATAKLSVNDIEDRKTTPKPFDGKIEKGRPLKPIDLNTHERRKLFEKDLGCVRELNASEISAFLGAMYNGLPLALFRFYPDKNKLERIISKVLETYDKYVRVEYGEKLNVKREVRFGKDFKAYLFSYLTASLLEKIGLISSQKNEVELFEIKNLTSNLFKFDRRFEFKISDDIHRLKRDIEKKDDFDWTIYSEVLCEQTRDLNPRHFLAHSGFERNSIELKKDARAVYTRYREEEIETIVRHCQEGLK